jgi:hypothetical protein
MLPVDEIPAAGVSPMLMAAGRCERVQLIEEVVPALVEQRAVRVVVQFAGG